VSERHKQEHKKKVAEILDGLRCPKDFECCTSGLERLCKAEDIGLETLLVCLETNPAECRFSVLFGGMHFCQCPLRVYIARKLNK
jgi:hypothetical protein